MLIYFICCIFCFVLQYVAFVYMWLVKTELLAHYELEWCHIFQQYAMGKHLRCGALYCCYYYYNHFTAAWTLSGTTQVSRYQKGKTNLDLLEQELVSGNGISWVICKSAPRPRQNHTSIPPLNFLQAGCPSCCPANSIKALKAL